MQGWRFSVIVIFAAVTGCSSIGVCSYSLSDNGWLPTDMRPADIVEIESRTGNDKSRWYINDTGEILVCRRLDARDSCAGIYSVYEPTDSGYVQAEELVCT